MENGTRPSIEITTQPRGLSYEQTVQGIIDLSVDDPWRNWEPRRHLLDALRYCESGLRHHGQEWRGELGPFVVDLAKIAPLSAQRFLEHANNDIIGNPDFDIATYGQTTLSIYRELGKGVGDYYTWSYPDAIKAGISPQEFHDFVQVSAKDGGRVFAKWMAWASSGVVRAGGDLEEFESVALKIREKGGVKLVKAFAHNAQRMVSAHTQEVFMQDFEDLTLDAIDSLGKDATYWLLWVLPTLVVKHKINPFDFYQDMADMAAKNGQVAAKQYLGGLCKNLGTLGGFAGEEAQERLSTARDSFMELRDTSGSTAASFFAFRGLDMSTPTTLRENKEAIAEFKQETPPKVFHDTAWFGAKIDTMELPDLLSLIGMHAATHKAEETIGEIKYAAGVIRCGGTVGVLPAFHPENGLLHVPPEEVNTEELWETLLKFGEPEEQYLPAGEMDEEELPLFDLYSEGEFPLEEGFEYPLQ